jgi:hypothetical protein
LADMVGSFRKEQSKKQIRDHHDRVIWSTRNSNMVVIYNCETFAGNTNVLGEYTTSNKQSELTW